MVDRAAACGGGGSHEMARLLSDPTPLYPASGAPTARAELATTSRDRATDPHKESLGTGGPHRAERNRCGSNAVYGDKGME